MKPHDKEFLFELDHGLIDPNDNNAIVWITFDLYKTQEEARNAASKTFNEGALWRIRKSENVSVSYAYQKVQEKAE